MAKLFVLATKLILPDVCNNNMRLHGEDQQLLASRACFAKAIFNDGFRPIGRNDKDFSDLVRGTSTLLTKIRLLCEATKAYSTGVVNGT